MGKAFGRVAAALVSLAILAPVAVSAQGDAIANRKADFQTLRKSLGEIKNVVDGKAGIETATAPAQAMADVGKRLTSKVNFPAGSDKGDTKALPLIWTDGAGFDKAAAGFNSGVGALVVAANAKNLDGLKAAFGETAKACGVCHDTYRAK
ncbi:hypothetical protein VZ95_16585 [Elstera litoralis]|uniref:Cytochrome C n=1 Tax=Elstera litoralis TaxID=552518 RepID=A0A0F3IQ14_9PROT|nr:cytochrome c [Elstera litoralis]KJV08628.1 hypothetical protein VZ95_16585 [Elstera litoralis]